ncbi:Potassium-transporting ATPase A chain [Salmonella enterica subsp. enterica serovar Give str. S5-487]|nr:Potassium-transporting ATPase A chain [Salmonella enterica subsp. enterica serovar Give str. S5-487]
MAAQGFLLIASFLLILLVLAKPLGSGLARLIAAVPLPGVAGIERILWRTLGITDHEMNWPQYLLALLTLNLLGLGILFCLLFWQEWLPLNPQRLPGLSWDLALNTAVSFVTNTNWQAYSGESTLSYFSQMAGLTVQNFLSAATGIAVVFALIRAFTRQNVHTLGNAWQDLVRITLWILFPVALIIALFFIQQGVPQNLSAYQPITTLEGAKQLLPMGPVASQEAIKMLGTNGGGFFNANSSHPFENPTALTNLAQMLAIFLIPAALCFAFGEAAGDRRQGRALLWAMSFIFVVCVAVVMWAEVQGNPHLLVAGADSSVNMEGKETRFGVLASSLKQPVCRRHDLASSLFAVVTTAASCGAVNAMHDSFTALGGMVPMWLMQIGEVVFGGVGSGLYGMLLFVLLAVFIAGLMIGRTPEYLGKKIDVREMKMTALAILVTPMLVLLGSALAMMTDAGRSAMLNPGPHGFSEVLYAVSSAANNNGSAFAGLSANSPFWNCLLAFCMFVGRFGVIIPVMAIAGSLVSKKVQPASQGTLATHGALFIGLLIGTVLLVGALTFIPALALGPVAEHFSLP